VDSNYIKNDGPGSEHNVFLYPSILYIMKITVLFFGVLTDIVTRHRLTIHDVKNVEELKRTLQEKYPDLQRYIYRVFVNKEQVTGNISLKDGDEVAMIPPFAGG
jgi:molybdopterin converting factor small subunit